MKKFLLVAQNTYRQQIRSRTFLLLTFGIPLLMVIAGAIPILSELRGDLPVVGIVDLSGGMNPIQGVEVNDETLQLKFYPEEETAKSSVETEEIGGYLVLPEDYFQGGSPVYSGFDEPNERLLAGLEKAVRKSYLLEAPAWQESRLENAAEITYQGLDTGEEITEGPAVILRVVVPIFLAFVFILTIFTGANQMGSVVVLEKEERAMEMVITSISPRELIGGKVLGMTLLSLTQIAVWLSAAVLAVVLFFLDDLAGQPIQIPWQTLLWAGLLGIPGYFLFATIGAGLGIIAGNIEQARQLAGMLGFVGMAPLYLMGVIVNAIDGPLAVGLTIFPLTAPTFATFRMALTEIPRWQLLVSLGTLLLTLLLSVWAVSRLFRTTMLLYGQKLKLSQIWEAFKQSGTSFEGGKNE
jgi:ABC-2 type transport system permease protein